MWSPLSFVHAKLNMIIDNQRKLIIGINVNRHKLDKVLFCLSKPGKMTIFNVCERSNIQMSDTIVFNVLLPPKSAPDVVARKFTFTVGDGDPTVLDLNPEQVSVDNLEGPEGAIVNLSLVDIDNAGLESQPSTLTVTIVDTFAPPAPGQIGLVNVTEKFGSDT